MKNFINRNVFAILATASVVLFIIGLVFGLLFITKGYNISGFGILSFGISMLILNSYCEIIRKRETKDYCSLEGAICSGYKYTGEYIIRFEVWESRTTRYRICCILFYINELLLAIWSAYAFVYQSLIIGDKFSIVNSVIIGIYFLWIIAYGIDYFLLMKIIRNNLKLFIMKLFS